jgi:hypothetical protein
MGKAMTSEVSREAPRCRSWPPRSARVARASPEAGGPSHCLGQGEHGVPSHPAVAHGGQHARRLGPVGDLADLRVQAAGGDQVGERGEVLPGGSEQRKPVA